MPARTASSGSGCTSPPQEEFDSLAREFDLHPLAVEDAINAHQRPKLEVYDDMVFIVLKTARYVDPTEVIEFGEILVFLGEDFVITVRHGEASDLHGVRERLEANPEHAEAWAPAAVLHAIVDKVVDDYAAGARRPRGRHRGGRGPRSSPPRAPDRAERIYKLKREVLQFHRATAPLSSRSTGWRAAHYDISPPGGARPTSAT